MNRRNRRGRLARPSETDLPNTGNLSLLTSLKDCLGGSGELDGRLRARDEVCIYLSFFCARKQMRAGWRRDSITEVVIVDKGAVCRTVQQVPGVERGIQFIVVVPG